MDKFSLLTTFILVCDRQSFAGAARELGISAAAISKQIALLERSLGIQLFIRTTRTLKLTDEAQAYLTEARKALEALHQADSVISVFKEEPQGKLKVITNRYFADNFIVPRLPHFLKKYPKIHLSLELAERVPDLFNENLDLQIGFSISGAPDSIQKQIGYTRYILCASPAYLNRRGNPKNPLELVTHAYIAHSMRKPNNILNLSGNQQIQLRSSLEVNDAQTMVELAIRGCGIIWVHDYMIQDALKKKQLVEILESYGPSAQPIYACYKQKLAMQPKLRVFLEMIAKKKTP